MASLLHQNNIIKCSITITCLCVLCLPMIITACKCVYGFLGLIGSYCTALANKVLNMLAVKVHSIQLLLTKAILTFKGSQVKKTEDYLKQLHKDSQFSGPNEEIWPPWPDKLKFFTSVTLLHHKNTTKGKSKQKINVMGRLRQKGDIRTVLKAAQNYGHHYQVKLNLLKYLNI